MSEQIIVVGHLFPTRISASILSGFAPEIEVRPQTPILKWAYSLADNRLDPTRQIGDSLLSDILVLKQDSEEDGGHIRRIKGDAVGNVRHLGTKPAEGALDKAVKLT